MKARFVDGVPCVTVARNILVGSALGAVLLLAARDARITPDTQVTIAATPDWGCDPEGPVSLRLRMVARPHGSGGSVTAVAEVRANESLRELVLELEPSEHLAIAPAVLWTGALEAEAAISRDIRIPVPDDRRSESRVIARYVTAGGVAGRASRPLIVDLGEDDRVLSGIHRVVGHPDGNRVRRITSESPR